MKPSCHLFVPLFSFSVSSELLLPPSTQDSVWRKFQPPLRLCPTRTRGLRRPVGARRTESRKSSPATKSPETLLSSTCRRPRRYFCPANFSPVSQRPVAASSRAASHDRSPNISSAPELQSALPSPWVCDE